MQMTVIPNGDTGAVVGVTLLSEADEDEEFLEDIAACLLPGVDLDYAIAASERCAKIFESVGNKLRERKGT